jgi:hypothetical protein
MLLCSLVLAAFSPVVASGQDGSNTLLGKWRSVDTSKGGIGALVDFHSDGTFDYSPGALLGGRYKVENGQLVITLKNSPRPEVQSIQSLTKDALRLGALSFKRIGMPEDVANLLVGSWVTVGTMPDLPSHGYYYFRASGAVTFFIPFRTDHCTYTVSGEQIRLTNRQGSIHGPMRWDRKVLTVPWGRDEASFERF